ncbi:MAG: hypothetical protein IJ583_01930 [Firmicutes bacterium]|nr:hypothetical protein [Bacillota bacterium]
MDDNARNIHMLDLTYEEWVVETCKKARRIMEETEKERNKNSEGDKNAKQK